jgi:large subunit ribosomal protein L24
VAGLFVKKGDTVQVIAGRREDKGTRGKVIAVYPERSRVLVEGIGRVKKHTKVTQSARGSQQGGIVTQESAVHVSNVQVVCPSCEKPTRVGHRRTDADDNGKTRSVRVCKHCDTDL